MTTPKIVDPKTGQVTYGNSAAGAIDPNMIPTEGGIPWGVLNQKYDTYDAEKNKKLLLLLKGGFEITKPDNAKLFIKQWKNEKATQYQDRVACATYENNFGEIINDFGASLFAKPLMVMPAPDGNDDSTPGEEAPTDPDPNEDWMKFQTHFDLENNNLAQFMRVQQTQSNALGCSYFGVDFDEDNGNRPYAYTIDIDSVLDYQKDDSGEFVFVVLRNDTCNRTNVRQIRNLVTTTFIVWTREKDIVQFDTYQITYPKGKEPDAEIMVPKVAAPEQDRSVDFKLIPIVECYTPDSLCVGNTIGQLAASMFVRATSFLHALNRSSSPILKYKQGAEISASGDLSIINEDDHRGSHTLATAKSTSAALIGPEDDLSWVEIKGESLKIFQQQLKDDKNEMYRLVAQLGSILSSRGSSSINTDKASGDAKQMDHLAKEQMLTAYAELVKKWVLKAFSLVFGAKQNEQDIIFKCEGMDNYQVTDETSLLAKVNAIPAYRANMPSPTSLKEVLSDLANEMHPFTNPGTLAKIRQEIFQAVDSMDLNSLHQAQVTGEVQDKTQTNINAPGGSDSNPNGSSSLQGEADKHRAMGEHHIADALESADQMGMGESGHPKLPVGSHLQTGENIEWQVPYKILQKDYQTKDLDTWVPLVPWTGPVEVETSDINFIGEEDWKANKPGPEGLDKVEKYVKIMHDRGFTAFKPVILAYTPHNDEKYEIIDGRHRVKAAQQAGLPIVAYIAHVGSVDGNTPHMQLHGKQIGANNSSGGGGDSGGNDSGAPNDS